MSQLDISYDPEIGGAEIGVLRLHGRATYKEAPELRRRLFETVADIPKGRLVVELAAVEEMDTAAMAVLVEGLLVTRNREPEIYFCTPSESVRKVFELAGLEDALTRCYGCLGDALQECGRR
jgi:anti-anti-sigma factor